jgi:DNA-binding NarL/FixJ family response regulator
MGMYSDSTQKKGRPQKPVGVALVHESVAIRYLYRKIFQSYGLSVLYEGANCREFHRQLVRGSKLPDVCLLEAGNTLEHVWEDLSRLNAAFPSMSLLICSAETDPIIIEQTMECGAYSVIEKGLHPNDYARAIASVKQRGPLDISKEMMSGKQLVNKAA